ncbi:MAG: alpha/beta fold hydrolase [Tissierellia bacterium]|nr:alpha/beta fold hydrolase [Tissierellia bacterium]
MVFWILILVLWVGVLVFTGKRMARSRTRTFLVGLEVLVAFYLVFRLAFPFLTMPQPRGKSQVKKDRIYLSHPTAYPDLATQGAEREVPIQVYYPENLRPGAHPLFIFSHGAFGVGTSNETLFFDLASRGYLVLSLDHPHHSFSSRLSSGERVFVDPDFFKAVVASPGAKDLEKTWSQLREWTGPRIEDLNLVLDRVLDDQLEPPYGDKIDKKRIILAGHSLGGGAALALGRDRPQDIQALVVLEAPFVGDMVGLEGDHYVFLEDPYPRPLLHIYSDSLWERLGTLPTYGQNARILKTQDPRLVSVHIDGVGHLGLTDLSLVSPLLTKLMDGGLDKKRPQEALEEINDQVLDFLEAWNP